MDSYVITSNNQLSGWIEKKLQSISQRQTCTHTHTKGHSHCLVVWCQSDPLQLSESWWNHYIWEVCSANQWDALKTAAPAASVGQQNRPSFHDSAQLRVVKPTFKSWTDWAMKICLICHIHLTTSCQPTTLLYACFLQASRQLFAGKMLLQPAGGRKCFPRVRWILEHGYLCCRNKQTYFSLANIDCWLWWFLFWLIKMYLSLMT